jgi:hypothetical protein
MCNKLGGRERAAICFVSPVEARIKRRERLIALFVDDCTALAHSTRKPGRRFAFPEESQKLADRASKGHVLASFLVESPQAGSYRWCIGLLSINVRSLSGLPRQIVHD